MGKNLLKGWETGDIVSQLISKDVIKTEVTETEVNETEDLYTLSNDEFSEGADAALEEDELYSESTNSKISVTEHHTAFFLEAGVPLYLIFRSERTADGVVENKRYTTYKKVWSIYGSSFMLALAALEGGYNTWLNTKKNTSRRKNNFFGIGGTNKMAFSSFENCVDYWLTLFTARDWLEAFKLVEETDPFTADQMNKALNTHIYVKKGVASYNYDLVDPNDKSKGFINYAQKIKNMVPSVVKRFKNTLEDEIGSLTKKSSELPPSTAEHIAKIKEMEFQIETYRNIYNEL